MITPRTRRPDADQIMVCIQPFHTVGIREFPHGFTAQQGTRLRADHPAVRLLPTHFVPDGLDDEALMRLRAERFPLGRNV